MAAHCLMAYRRGEESLDAEVGAMLEAESFDNHRLIARFCAALAKALSRR